MSTPDELQSQQYEGAAKTMDTKNVTPSGPADLAVAVQQLRTLVCGVGAGLLVVSLALSAFVYKQNRNLSGVISTRQRQIAQLQANQQPMMFAFNELGKYSMGKPELMAIFSRHGIQINPPTNSEAPPAKPASPKP